MVTTVPPTRTDLVTPAAKRDKTDSLRTASDLSADANSASAGPAVVVDLSNTAKAAAQSAPGTKDFATVAKDARAALDAASAATGKKASIYTTASEAKTMFADLDRRSLYAIKANAGGQFTQDEQVQAGIEMRVRMDAFSGLDNPMLGASGRSAALDMYKKSIAYLDQASEEEKGSFDWAKQRAATQSDYELTSRSEGEEPEKLDSTNPLVKILKAAFDMLKELGDPSKQVEDIPLYKQALQLFDSQTASSSSSVDIKA